MNHLKMIGAGILALGIGLPVWADMTKEEVIAKIEAGLSQAQRARDHDQRVTAVEALLRAGIAPEKCVDIVKSALARNVPVAEVAMLAREVENRARGDKARAEQYAREHFASAEKRHSAGAGSGGGMGGSGGGSGGGMGGSGGGSGGGMGGSGGGGGGSGGGMGGSGGGSGGGMGGSGGGGGGSGGGMGGWGGGMGGGAGGGRGQW